MFKRTKAVCLLLSAVFTLSVVISGCGTSQETQSAQSQQQAAEQTQQAAEQTQQAAEQSEEMVTIKGWMGFTPDPAASADIKSMNDQLLWKELAKETHVQVVWENVNNKEAATQMGLLMASGNLPDFVAGINPQQLANYGRQGSLQPLEKIIDEQVPVLKDIMSQYPDVKAQITSPDGHIYFYPRLLLDPVPQCFTGWWIRGDWLKEQNLNVPETMDELYSVLKALKSANPNRYPFFENIRAMIWNFGVGAREYNATNNDFFLEDNQVKFGPTDPRYKDALVFLNKLYAEGLIDPEYLSLNGDQKNEKVMQETGGFGFGSNAGQLTRYNTMLKAGGKNPGFIAMAPLKSPAGQRNIPVRHGAIDSSVGMSVCVTSKNTEAVAKLINYIYGDKGTMLANFGIEGDTYNLVDGKPVFTDKVAKNANMNILTYINNYISWASLISSNVHPEQYKATLSEEGLKGNAIAVQNRGTTRIPFLNFSDEELKEVLAIERDINTFIDENTHGYIMGKKKFSTYEDFQQGLKKIGSDRLLEMYNGAYNRYKAVAEGK